jgi:O-antigen/teichoic acid export membrane protein
VHALARSALARAASFVPTALATLFTSHLIISEYGINTFDNFAVVLALIFLIPLSDLGVGAAVTSALALDGPGSSSAERTVLTSARVLAVSTAATASAAALVTALHLWPTILGAAAGPNLWCGAAVVIYALSFVPGLGQSMLLGVQKNHVSVVVQMFFNPIIAVLVGAVVLTGRSPHLVILMPCVALVLINLIASRVAAKATGISWPRITRRLTRPDRYPGARIRAMSGPVLLISLATPIALQSDRLVLSHVSTARDVAQYSLGMQIFAPALALLAATAQPLWPIYASARNRGERGPKVLRTVLLFGAASAALGLTLAALVGPISRLVAGSNAPVSGLLAIAGTLVVLTSGLAYPVAMSLMDPDGVRIVVACTVAALPLNIGLSIVLARHLGAPGPLFATAAVGLVVQVVPALLFSTDRQTAGRHRRRRRAPVAPGGYVVTQEPVAY